MTATSTFKMSFDSIEIWCKLHDAILDNDFQACQNILQGKRINLENIHTDLEKYFDTYFGQKTLTFPALHLSCVFRKLKIIELLCRNGADVHYRDNFDRSPLNTLIQYWYRSNPLEMLDADVRKRMKNEHEHCANCMRVLLNYGANPSEVIDARGHTLLHFCAKKNLTLPLHLLIQSGANIERTDESGLTPLLYGAKTGSEFMIEFMLGLGANSKAVDKYGNGLLHILCKNNQITPHYIHHYLKNIHVDTENENGQTALMVSAHMGNTSKIKVLLNNGAEPCKIDKTGKSAIFHLLDNNEPRYCKYGFWNLLIRTKQICIYDSDGRLPAKLLSDNLQKLKRALERESSTPTSLYRLCIFNLYNLVNHNKCPKEVAKFLVLNCPRKIAIELMNFPKSMSVYWKNRLNLSFI